MLQLALSSRKCCLFSNWQPFRNSHTCICNSITNGVVNKTKSSNLKPRTTKSRFKKPHHSPVFFAKIIFQGSTFFFQVPFPFSGGSGLGWWLLQHNCRTPGPKIAIFKGNFLELQTIQGIKGNINEPVSCPGGWGGTHFTPHPLSPTTTPRFAPPLPVEGRLSGSFFMADLRMYRVRVGRKCLFGGACQSCVGVEVGVGRCCCWVEHRSAQNRHIWWRTKKLYGRAATRLHGYLINLVTRLLKL